MNNKRVTIYDLAKAINLSPSYISKALNNHPSVGDKMKEKVRKAAKDLNYKHNSYAANLRMGISKTIGVIVPHINKSFFSELIAGIEEICFEHDYGLIICQSQESYEKECRAIDTLIRQNVDGILISVSAETNSSEHLQNIINHDTILIQIDRFIENFNSYKVTNDNEKLAYNATMHLINQGYQNIVFLGWTEQLTIDQLRKRGYLQAMKTSGLTSHIYDNAIQKDRTKEIITLLLSSNTPPDAFLTFSDEQALCVLQVANSLGIKVPQELGIIGSGNDILTEITTPTLSAVNQKSIEIGRKAANLYFEILAGKNDNPVEIKEEIIQAEIIGRESTAKNS